MSAVRLSPEAIQELAEAAAWHMDLVIRRALLPRFPFALILVDLGVEVRVLAVAHGKRRPGYWLNRVES